MFVMYKYLLLSLLFATSANAVNLNWVQNPNDITELKPELVTSTKDKDYKGRVDESNLLDTVDNTQSTDTGSLTKTVSSRKSSSSSQIDNLEANTGELVQKVEDDRVKIAKDHNKDLEDLKDKVSDTYNTLKGINEGKLGEETDPSFKNAFKCKDPTNCNTNTDARVISDCNTKGSEMLRWDGKKWTCINLFKITSAPSCASYQWKKNVNGGQVCVDYIFEWRHIGYTACNTSKQKTEIYKCYKKKTATDTNAALALDSECNKKTKPVEKVSLCTSSWIEGGWSDCSKTCGGGYKTRQVTCPEGYHCDGAKPATVDTCNTQSCSASWVTGDWSSCGNIGDKICKDENNHEYACGDLWGKTRVVYCPDGYTCLGSKPSEVTACDPNSK